MAVNAAVNMALSICIYNKHVKIIDRDRSDHISRFQGGYSLSRPGHAWEAGPHVSVEYAYVLHERIPNSQLLLFDAGHAAHLRCEDAYNKAVMNFFASV